MKPAHLSGAFATAVLLPATQGTWCDFYNDDACTDTTDPNTSYDCGNNNVFGNSGGFVACHADENSDDSRCVIGRCNDESCATTYNTDVDPDHSCHSTGGPGPFYRLHKK
ncbi:hypothetical protein PG985_013159 [Apiospora marii]|uniref:Uncharacterized protein n=1 Tax=Apiospora marii TaxID=335849 RepID=A0ABR1R9I0_9PEZI